MFCPDFLIMDHLDFCLHHLAALSGPGHSTETEQSAGCSKRLESWVKESVGFYRGQGDLRPIKDNRSDIRGPGFYGHLFLQSY